MKVTKLLLVICTACAVGLLTEDIGFAQMQPAKVREHRRTFERQWRKIDRDFDKEHKTALAKYEADLQKVLGYMKKRNDDFGVRPTEEELKRFEEEQTVPTNISQGTPKLIRQARDRYMSNIKPMKLRRKGRRDRLLDGYLSILANLEATMEAKSKTADADAVRAERDRVVSSFGSGSVKKKGDDFSVIKAVLALRGNYLNDLSMVYYMKARHNFRMRDMSGKKKHGRLIGASADKEEPEALSFLKFHEIIELEQPVPLREKWTMVIEAKFPLADPEPGKDRVLVTGAFRKDHIVVDPIGMLGVGVNTFTTSGYNVNDLEGWKRIVVVGMDGKTAFFIDGEQVGTARAQCVMPVAGIANCMGYGKPWGGAIRSVLVWNRLMTAGEIEKLPKTLVK